MRTTTSRGIATMLLALTTVALLIAGPIMIYKGYDGQQQITQQLTAQKIVFPAKGNAGLPKSLQSYGGQQVTTGPQAKAYADMVEIHVKEATHGLTYSQVSAKWMAGGSKDTTLAAERQTAFMGESLRGTLMSAYQAWELSWLVIGLGSLLTAIGVVVGFTTYAYRPTRLHEHPIPVSPAPHATVEHQH
jgi:hypothetical protein